LVTEAFCYSWPAVTPAPHDTIVGPIIVGSGWQNFWPVALEERNIGNGTHSPYVYGKTFPDIGSTHFQPIAGTFGIFNGDQNAYDLFIGFQLTGRHAEPFRALDVPHNSNPYEPERMDSHRLYLSASFSNNADPLKVKVYALEGGGYAERMNVAIPTRAAGIIRLKGFNAERNKFFPFLDFDKGDAVDGVYKGRMDVYLDGEDAAPEEHFFRIPVPALQD